MLFISLSATWTRLSQNDDVVIVGYVMERQITLNFHGSVMVTLKICVKMLQ